MTLQCKKYLIAPFTLFNWQLQESQLASHSVKEELAELERRYHEKVGQWESSQEALDQLTDELQVNQNQLRESQQKVDHFKSLMGALHEQVDTLKQQVRPHMNTWHEHKCIRFICADLSQYVAVMNFFFSHLWNILIQNAI